MTAQEVAEYLRLNVMTVYKLAKQRKIPGAIKVGRTWRFKRSLLDAAFGELLPPEGPAQDGAYKDEKA